MKLLLDEQLPRRLAHRLVPLHDALTVQDMDWRGKQNGELLKLLQEHRFEAFFTADKQMQHQQSWRHYPLPVLLLDVLNLKLRHYKAIAPAGLGTIGTA